MADEWLFVDDQPAEASAFADRISDEVVRVVPISAKDFRDECLTGVRIPSGVLLDVELSNEVGERGSGPGIAQDVRVKQRSGSIAEFPLIRFARRSKVDESIGGDTSSNDLFDLRIQKEELHAGGADAIRTQMIGAVALYSSLISLESLEENGLLSLLGLEPPQLLSWTGPAFLDRMAAERQIAVHTAALVFTRTVLFRTGLLIDEKILSYRLGVDMTGPGWADLKRQLEGIQYRGIAGSHFHRWWARGLEDWWYRHFGTQRSLSSLSVAERIEKVRTIVPAVQPLQMPRGSAGDKPWRACELSLEKTPPLLVPVDPSESARLVPRGDFPSWVDPLVASAAIALASNDRRLSHADIKKLRAKYARK